MTDPTNSVPDIIIHPKPEPMIPPITNAWRRFFAFMVDLVVLGVVAEGLGFLFANPLYEIGPFGQLLGLVFILPYFGVMNSRLCGGQTLGKKLFKIAVRGADNLPISLGKSFLRAVLLIAPIHLLLCLTFWMNNRYVTAFIASLVYGWLTALVIVYLVNKQARQTSHDLIVHTFVVDLRKDKIEEFPETSKPTRILALACLAVVVVGYTGVTLFNGLRSNNSNLQGLYDAVSTDSRFFTTRVSNTSYLDTDNKTEKTLTIDLWYKGALSPFITSQINRDLAPLIFENVPDIDSYNTIQVKISSRRYLGLYSYNLTNNFTGTVAEWQQSAGE
jgi:uncharacterized RDD family membrane protein YckC